MWMVKELLIIDRLIDGTNRKKRREGIADSKIKVAREDRGVRRMLWRIFFLNEGERQEWVMGGQRGAWTHRENW